MPKPVKEVSKGNMAAMRELEILGAYSEQQRERILNSGMLQLLVCLLKDESESAKETLRALEDLLFFESEDQSVRNVQERVAAQLQPLVDLLKEGSEDDRVHAAYALGNLSKINEEPNAEEVNAGLQPLVMLLKQGSEVGKRQAAKVLVSLARVGLQRYIVKANAVQPLVKLLNEGSETSKEQAAFALGYLAFANEERSAQITRAGAVQPLIGLLMEGSSVSAKESAAFLLACFTDSDEMSMQMQTAAGVVLKPLVSLLEEGSDDAKQSGGPCSQQRSAECADFRLGRSTAADCGSQGGFCGCQGAGDTGVGALVSQK